MYTMLIQNLASKREWVIQRLRNTGDNWLSYNFEGFKMPDDAPYGEYSCILFFNSRTDCSYDVRDDLKETVIHTADGDVKVRDLRCEYFLLKYGDEQKELEYLEGNKDFYYYEHK